MGRALLIICAGVFVSLGIVSLGANSQTEGITNMNVDYASQVQAKNTALTAIQLAMEEINQNENWLSSGQTWNPSIDGAEVSLSYDVISPVGGTALDPDTLVISSTSEYNGVTRQIRAKYIKQALDYIPDFKAALSLATNNFNFSMGGSSSIKGKERSGTCPDLPGVAVLPGVDNTDWNDIQSETGGSKKKGISGNPDAYKDASLSYQPVDELVARLENLPTTKKISGNYKGDFGTADNPGVFFVEDYTKLTGGIADGHGILVIRSEGEFDYEGSLDVAGNFTFNGLVIFENAFSLNGRGTPSINGSVLVGNTPNTNKNITVDISGNIQLQYDCEAKKYARLASANSVKQNRYSMISMYE